MRSSFTIWILSSRDNKWNNPIQILHSKMNPVVHCHQEKPWPQPFWDNEGAILVKSLLPEIMGNSLFYLNTQRMKLSLHISITEDILNIRMDCNAQPSGRSLNKVKMMCRNIIMMRMACIIPCDSGQAYRL
jgi:hypothetical protein